MHLPSRWRILARDWTGCHFQCGSLRGHCRLFALLFPSHLCLDVRWGNSRVSHASQSFWYGSIHAGLLLRHRLRSSGFYCHFERHHCGGFRNSRIWHRVIVSYLAYLNRIFHFLLNMNVKWVNNMRKSDAHAFGVFFYATTLISVAGWEWKMASFGHLLFLWFAS